MDKQLLSVGLDVGTTTTQLVFSQLQVRNRGSAFTVPRMEITDRHILYKSPVHFTPLLSGDLIDGEKLRQLVEEEYQKAGIRRSEVDTGAVIITGETSRSVSRPASQITPSKPVNAAKGANCAARSASDTPICPTAIGRFS